MEVNVKRLAIILIVVGVAAYFVWKNRKEEKAETKGSGSNATPSDTPSAVTGQEDVETLMDALGLTAAEKKAVRNFNPGLTYQAWIQEMADKRGISYNLSLIMEAVYQSYYKEGSWVSGSAESRYITVYKKIMQTFSTADKWV